MEEPIDAAHELAEVQWKLIGGLLPGKSGGPGWTAADNRRSVSAVLWVARTGSPWRELPERLGPWKSVFVRFSRWCKRGVWEAVSQALNRDADLEHRFLDLMVVRAHQHSTGAKGGSTTKRSAALVGA